MAATTLKVNTQLSGDDAMDFNRLSLSLKITEKTKSKPEQQRLLINSAILVLDATLVRFSKEKGQKYPELQEILEFAGCTDSDIQNLLNPQGDDR